jgi:hypothetical protein
MSDEIILEAGDGTDEVVHYNYVDIIENQLTLITTLSETPDEIYETFTEDKIRCISLAMKLIYKSQKAIHSLL